MLKVRHLTRLVIMVFIPGLFGPAGFTLAQDGMNSDDLFQQARDLAFNGKRQAAREVCDRILTRNPDYVDARLLLGRLMSWDSQYDQARVEIRRVLEAKPDYADARVALIDVELWSGNAGEALRLCDEGINKAPENALFHYKKARALENLGNLKAAAAAARQAININPAQQEAQTLLKRIEGKESLYTFKVDYGFDAFNQTFDPWHVASFSLSRSLPFGSVIGRVTVARRFNQTAAAYEIDAYPHIRKGTYAYLNVGYSASNIFPKTRLGGEVYQNLPSGFEASFGARHLRFSASQVTIFTGSVGKYFGNYWFSFRPYFTPSKIGASRSGYFTARRYFADAKNYLSFTFGAGSYPDGQATSFDVFRLKSYSAGVEAHKRFGNRLAGTVSFGFENQKTGLNSYRKHYSLGVGFEKTF